MTMGEIRATVTLEKLGDREDVFRGHCVEADVRRATVEGISRTPAWHEAAGFPNGIRAAIADLDNRKQPPRIDDQCRGMIRRMGQYDYEQHGVIARQLDKAPRQPLMTD